MALAFICKCKSNLELLREILLSRGEMLLTSVIIPFFSRYGVVLRKLDLVKEAIDVFVEATHVLPLHWGAWLELCNLITDKEMVNLR